MNVYQGIQKTAEVRSDQNGPCRECNRFLDGGVDDQINHYLGHGWVLLHVGSEAGRHGDAVLSSTVAILGSD